MIQVTRSTLINKDKNDIRCKFYSEPRQKKLDVQVINKLIRAVEMIIFEVMILGMCIYCHPQDTWCITTDEHTDVQNQRVYRLIYNYIICKYISI